MRKTGRPVDPEDGCAEEVAPGPAKASPMGDSWTLILRMVTLSAQPTIRRDSDCQNREALKRSALGLPLGLLMYLMH